MPVPLAVPLALRQVEEAHARVGEERLDGGAGVVLDPVADDEHLDRRFLLAERARHGVRQQRGVTIGRNENCGVGHGRSTRVRSCSTAATISAASRALDFGRGPPPRCSTKTRSSAKRELAGGLDPLPVARLGACSKNRDVRVPTAPERRSALGAEQLHHAAVLGGARRDDERVPRVACVECRLQVHDAAPRGEADCPLRPWNPAEDLKSDRKVVWGEDPGAIHVVVPRSPAGPRVESPCTAAAVPSRDRGQLQHARVVAPLVHHEEPVAAELARGSRPAKVGAERLLDEDRDALARAPPPRPRMRARRRRDDDPLDARSAPRRRDDAARPARHGPSPRRLRASNDGDLAFERAQVAQDVDAPTTAPTRPTTITPTLDLSGPSRLSASLLRGRLDHGQALGGGLGVSTALTIAPFMPSATSCVNSTLICSKPAASSPASYSAFESAPAMQPT